ncbi:MAG TPA: hypothetical protein PK156_18875, partial [Polyangium sp.]|nr:hypothetical protein [Polyangium sp.]
AFLAGGKKRNESENDRIFLFIDLSASDVVAYLFGNDLDFFFNAALELRKATLQDFAKWLNPPKEGSFEIVEPQAPELRRQFCRNTYSLYGVLPPMDLAPNATANEFAERIANRVTNQATLLRPIVFLSTVPGHEKDNLQLRETLSRHSRTSNSFSFANGIFDLVHDVMGPSTSMPSSTLSDATSMITMTATGSLPSQQDAVRATLLLLNDLSENMGTKEGRTKILRTNTVWTRPLPHDQTPIATKPPNSGPVHERQALGDEESSPISHGKTDWPLEPAAAVIAVMEQAFVAIASNHQAPSHAFVKDLEPFMHELRSILDKQIQNVPIPGGITKENKRLSHSAQGRAVLQAFDDALGRLGLTLMTRTYCTTHALREEIAVLPGASFHKLIATYSVILGEMAQRLTPILGSNQLPRILCTLGGVRPARAHWYFRDENRGFRLAIFEVAGTSLLSPQRVIFSFAHELMHIFVETRNGRRLLDLLTPALLAEAAEIVSDQAMQHGWKPPALLGPEFEQRIANNLVRDHQSRCARKNQSPASFDVAIEVLQILGDRPSYLYLVLQESTNPADDPALGEQQISLKRLAALEKLSADILVILRKLLRMFTECAIDILAGTMTSALRYPMILQDLGTMDAPRTKLVQSVLASTNPASQEQSTTGARSNNGRQLQRGLIALAQKFRDSLGDANPLLERLTLRLSQENMGWGNDEDLRLLLQFLREKA